MDPRETGAFVGFRDVGLSARRHRRESCRAALSVCPLSFGREHLNCRTGRPRSVCYAGFESVDTTDHVQLPSSFENEYINSRLGGSSGYFIDHGTSIIVASTPSSMDNVFEDQDLIGGVILAVALAFGASFLQSRRNQNDFVLSPPTPKDDSTISRSDDESAQSNKNSTLTGNETLKVDQSTTFGEWKEMTQPESYVLYNTRLRNNNSQKSSQPNVFESPWVLVGLLLLFTPIFSFEFFLTVSRNILCGGWFGPEVTNQWCSAFVE